VPHHLRHALHRHPIQQERELQPAEQLREGLRAAHEEAAAAELRALHLHHARAIADYERSAPLCKGLDGTVDRLMKLLVRKGDHARVVAVATGILERIPRDGWTLWQRGRAHRALSQHPQALADLRRAAEIGQTSASEDLAWYYETGTGVARDLQRALELYRAAEAIDSPTAPAHVQRVSAMMAGGRR
jgi:TPR repeat protein